MATNKPRTVRSMRGEEVNFDLAEIKNKILAEPEPESSRQRARFIDSKRRRSPRRRGDEIVAEQKNNEAAVRAAIAEQKRSLIKEEKDSVPHVQIEDVVVSEEPVVRKIKRD